jgi:hypothetical protein
VDSYQAEVMLVDGNRYLYPCIPYEKTGAGKVGFFSGFKPVDAILTTAPKYSILINDTDPIFYYCSAPDACIEYQMVGVINPNATTLLSTQKDFAANSTYALNPGEDFPTEGGSTTASTTTPYQTASHASTTSSSSATAASATAAATSGQKSSFPAGAIAGIVVGVVVIIALAAALFYFVGRSRRSEPQETKTAASGMLGSTARPASPDLASAEPVFGPGGMVYVPVKASDFHRMSSPPTYGSADGAQPPHTAVSTQEAGRMSPGHPRFVYG